LVAQERAQRCLISKDFLVSGDMALAANTPNFFRRGDKPRRRKGDKIRLSPPTFIARQLTRKFENDLSIST